MCVSSTPPPPWEASVPDLLTCLLAWTARFACIECLLLDGKVCVYRVSPLGRQGLRVSSVSSWTARFACIECLLLDGKVCVYRVPPPPWKASVPDLLTCLLAWTARFACIECLLLDGKVCVYRVPPPPLGKLLSLIYSPVYWHGRQGLRVSSVSSWTARFVCIECLLLDGKVCVYRVSPLGRQGLCVSSTPPPPLGSFCP